MTHHKTVAEYAKGSLVPGLLPTLNFFDCLTLRF